MDNARIAYLKSVPFAHRLWQMTINSQLNRYKPDHGDRNVVSISGYVRHNLDNLYPRDDLYIARHPLWIL